MSENGTIKVNNKIKTPYLNADGYLVVSLNTDDGWRSVSVARLVALAYIPNPDNLPEVNHKDYNRTNPHKDNLEWISHGDNVRYSKQHLPDRNGINNPNYGNHALSNKYKDDPEYAKEKQGRPGSQNGRCVPIQLLYDGVLEKEFKYITECCKYVRDKYAPNVQDVESIRSRIRDSIKNNVPYKKHLTFVINQETLND